MSTAYTPGDWEAVPDEPFVYALNEGGSNRFFLSVNGGWQLGCRNSKADERTTREELLANARLIAAAPEMLDAARAAWNCIAELHPTHARIEVGQMLLAVIEKATGEFPE